MQTSRKTSPRNSWVDVGPAAEAAADAAEAAVMSAPAPAPAPDQSIVFVAPPPAVRIPKALRSANATANASAAAGSRSGSQSGSQSGSGSPSPTVSRSGSVVLVPPTAPGAVADAAPGPGEPGSSVVFAEQPLDLDALLQELYDGDIAAAPLYTSPIAVARSGGAQALTQLVLSSAPEAAHAAPPTRDQSWARALDALKGYGAGAQQLPGQQQLQVASQHPYDALAVPLREKRYSAADMVVAASAGLACGLLLTALWLRAQHVRAKDVPVRLALPPPTNSAVVPPRPAPVPAAVARTAVAPAPAASAAAASATPQSIARSLGRSATPPPPSAASLPEQFAHALTDLSTELMGLLTAFNELVARPLPQPAAHAPPALLPHPRQVLNHMLQRLRIYA